MSLRKDYSLTKDFNFEEEKEVIEMYDSYDDVLIPGHYFKSQLLYFLKIYKGSCGEGEEINKVYSALENYARINITDPDFTFADEAEKLRELNQGATEYAKELDILNQQLDTVLDGWMSGIHSTTLTPEQRAQDLNYVARVEFMFNRRAFAFETNRYTSIIMSGGLDVDDPEEAYDSEGLDSIELPVFTHIPVVEDLDQSELAESRLIQILFNIVKQDSYAPMRMLYGCDSGNVIVRLWQKENGEDKPCYFSIDKSGVYLDKIGRFRQKTIWPGIVEAAVNQFECSDEDLPYAILGPDLKDFDLDYLLGPIEMPEYDNRKNYNEMVHEYIKCYFDVYTALLGTNSLIIKDTVEYTKLKFALWEMISALSCCFDRTFDVAAPAIELLETYIAGYKKFVQQNPSFDPMAKKRLLICDTMEDLIKLGNQESPFRKHPRLYFEKSLAARIAKVLLESMKAEITPQSLEEKTEAILNTEAFKKKAAKLNIHMMKTATDKFAASVLAKMEGRK